MTRSLVEKLAGRTTPFAHHITLALEGRRQLAHDTEGRRLLARIVYENLEGRGLLSFGAADDHLHVQVEGSRADCGRLVRGLGAALHKRLGHEVSFEPSRYQVVEEPRHARNAVFYGFRQEQHHRTNVDPLFDASSLPDLIGARVLLTRAREPLGMLMSPARRVDTAGGPRVRVLGAATSALVRRRLPRIRDEDLLALVGGAALLDAPPALEQLEDAAAAAVGLADLQGIDPATVLARRAAVQLASEATSLPAIAHLLRTPRRTIQRDAASPTTPSIRRAVELQLRMRSKLLVPATNWNDLQPDDRHDALASRSGIHGGGAAPSGAADRP